MRKKEEKWNLWLDAYDPQHSFATTEATTAEMKTFFWDEGGYAARDEGGYTARVLRWRFLEIKNNLKNTIKDSGVCTNDVILNGVWVYDNIVYGNVVV